MIGNRIEGSKSETVVLSQEELDAFSRQGFLLLKGAIDAHETQTLRAVIEKTMGCDCDGTDKGGDSCLIAPREFRVAPLKQERILDTARALVGFDCRILDEGGCPVLVVPERGQECFVPFNLHIDGYPNSVSLLPDRRCLIVLLLLTDTGEFGGATAVAPGGHRKVFECWSKDCDRLGYNRGIPNGISLESLSPVAGRAGDAILMHYLLPHAHSRNFSGHTRVAINIPLFAVSPDACHSDAFFRSPSNCRCDV